METSILKELGLNDNEIAIYLKLLSKGASSASELAELTKLHRTHVYDLLESMAKKAIIASTIKENKKFFEAVSPEKLEVLLINKEQEIKEDKEKLDKLVKELKAITSGEKTKLLASIHLGKQGFISQLNDIIRTLNKGEEYLVLGFTTKSQDTLKYFLPGFTKRRVEKGIKRKVIQDSEVRSTSASRQPLQEARFLPKDYKIPMGMIIYRDVLILVIIEDDYMTIRIDNKKVAENFKRYFDLIWKTSKK